jgi:hypothetical protein
MDVTQPATVATQGFFSLGPTAEIGEPQFAAVLALDP